MCFGSLLFDPIDSEDPARVPLEQKCHLFLSYDSQRTTATIVEGPGSIFLRFDCGIVRLVCSKNIGTVDSCSMSTPALFIYYFNKHSQANENNHYFYSCYHHTVILLLLVLCMPPFHNGSPPSTWWSQATLLRSSSSVINRSPPNSCN